MGGVPRGGPRVVGVTAPAEGGEPAPRQTDRCPRTGKLRHRHRSAAEQALVGHRTAMRHKGSGFAEDGVMGVFQCRHCGGGWHVGTASDGQGDKRAKGKAEKRKRAERLQELRDEEADCV